MAVNTIDKLQFLSFILIIFHLFTHGRISSKFSTAVEVVDNHL